MIGYLTGTIIDTQDQYILLNVHGVGYAVYVPEGWRGKAIEGSEYSLFVSTQVRDDAIELYGFPLSSEKRLFELLLTVSGIGPKTALLIVGYGTAAVEEAVATAEVDFFTSIPRIGKKNAQKIIIELKNKLGGIADLNLKDEPVGQKQELMEALTHMGFSRTEVQQFIRDNMDETQTIEVNMKHALQFLGKRR